MAYSSGPIPSQDENPLPNNGMINDETFLINGEIVKEETYTIDGEGFRRRTIKVSKEAIEELKRQGIADAEKIVYVIMDDKIEE